ncbi:type IV pilus modification PilV family protein [Thermovibrio ammonificans]|jgi:general secretion pathway protein I|uniref:Type II secretion system protein I n=1 Tax=Thermovibrio ammonificans (strain DSM 15698 / JCM 12110 / HB-1) TaxID=648996 RepID=E8T4U9_THEA1|nr:type II secretion system protein [Thermovibrio ammonificans]ADU96361.1 type II secretion system protein I [Thermovibrio ammonificans HB-1]
MRYGFTLLEVLIATAIVGMAFGAFILLTTSAVSTADQQFKTAVSAVAAHNCINEAVYLNRSCQNKKVEVLGCTVELKQDFQEIMGIRVVRVEARTPNWGKLVEVYEAR